MIWGGIAALVVWAVRSGGTGRDQSQPTALEILERRLASGDIARDEYDELRRLLGPGRGAKPPVGSAAFCPGHLA
jgi:putative membrane protein